MFATKKAILLILAALIGALSASSNAAAADPVESARDCIERAELAMKALEVPERLELLVERVRALNPLLSQLSYIKFADSARVDLRLVETGLVRAEEMDAVADLCASFVARAYPTAASGEQVCDLEQFTNDYEAYEQYLAEAARHPDYDRKLGAAKLCVQF